MAHVAPDPKTDITEQYATRVRVMIVDDSLIARTVLQRVIGLDSRLELVASASSATQAIAALDRAVPDVILLDLEMPGMGGLEALPKILAKAKDAQILVVSSLTAQGAEATLAALTMGAADTLLKPAPGKFDSEYRADLLRRILELGCAARKDHRKSYAIPPATPPARHRGPAPRLIAIGASTGGIHALTMFLRNLPPAVDLPILVTQHLPASFFTVFANQLELAGSRPARVAGDGDRLKHGTIIIAPPDGHMTIRLDGGEPVVKIVRHTAASGCMPSVDPMLSSLAETHGPAVICVMLSGMGRDGLEGARLLARAGGTILAQDPESSAVWGMPGAVADDGLTDAVLPPDRLARHISTRLSVPV